MARQDIERQQELEPQRIEYAVKKITELGYDITHRDNTKIKFFFKGEQVTLFPYSGWHTGKSVTDGRGLNKLLEQIRPDGKKKNLDGK